MSINNRLINTGGGGGPLPPATADGEYMVATGISGQLYVSNTFGQTWIERPLIPSTVAPNRIRVSSDGQRMAVRANDELWVSSDTGISFTQVNTNNMENFEMSANGVYLFYWDGNGNMYRSTNFGTSFSGIGGSNKYKIMTVNYEGQKLYARSPFGGTDIFWSSNYGNSWGSFNESQWAEGPWIDPTGNYSYIYKLGQGIFANTSFAGTYSYRTNFLTYDMYVGHNGNKVLCMDTDNNLTYSASGWSGGRNVSSCPGIYQVEGNYYGTYAALRKNDGIYVSSTVNHVCSNYIKTLSKYAIYDFAVSKMI